ncbi:MAG: hypothetical protein JNL34_02825 [Anaerolineae bacterium]|nr:hypothetical protein [Anaerolineae bacterium]
MQDTQARAFDTLSKLKEAAPPVAAARITEVTDLLEQLAAENKSLSARLQALELRLAAVPVPSVAIPSRPQAPESTPMAGDPRPATNGAQAEPPDHLDTGVLAGSDRVEGAMPSAEAILSQYRFLLRPLVQSLFDEAGFGTRARTRMEELLSLLDALDRLNAIRRGLIVVHPIVFDPAELLRQTRRSLAARASARDQQFEVNTDASLPPVLADGDLSQEILDTLVDNAVRYTDYGGKVTVAAETLGTDVLFTVTDTGIGFEPDEADRIGTPFFRAHHQALVQGQPGAGLRLFIARQLLDVQGGELFFSSEAGLGASFSFTLPVASR